jgi:hypothetical protein
VSKRVESGGEHVATRSADLEADLIPELEQGSQRLRGEEAVAGAPHEADVAAALVCESPDKGRLADAGFPADQHQPAASGDGRVEMLAECGELGLALDQIHELMVRP